LIERRRKEKNKMPTNFVVGDRVRIRDERAADWRNLLRGAEPLSPSCPYPSLNGVYVVASLSVRGYHVLLWLERFTAAEGGYALSTTWFEKVEEEPEPKVSKVFTSLSVRKQDGSLYKITFIQAPLEEAQRIYLKKVDASAVFVSSLVWGWDNYEVFPRQYDNLQQATASFRNGRFSFRTKIYPENTCSISLGEFLAQPYVTVIRAKDILPEDRMEIPF
jgi:hypothetical protein